MKRVKLFTKPVVTEKKSSSFETSMDAVDRLIK